MKIARIETILTCPDRNYLIVKITADSGLVGYGDATLNGRELAVQALIERHLSSWLTGWDAGAIEKIWQSVLRQQYWRGGAIQMTALSGIDMALWDLKGKSLHAPVYSLLGGKSRDRIRVYLHAHGVNDDSLLRRCRELIAEGCTAIRYSFDTRDPARPGVVYRQAHQDIGAGPRIEVSEEDLRVIPRWDAATYLRDLGRVTALLRTELGPEIDLIHDVHQRLSPIMAARAARTVEPFDLFFLEDPVEPLYKPGLKIVRERSATPIGVGELFTTLQDCLPALQNNWLDYLRLDISHAGGVTGIVKAAAVADACQILMALHGPSDISPLAHAANFHVDTAIPNFGIQEFIHADPRATEVFTAGYRYSEGYVTLEDLPGLGIEVDEKAAAGLPYAKSFLPLLQDKDGGVQNW